MKVLIFGGNGLLGQNLIQAKPMQAEVLACGLEEASFIPLKANYKTVDVTNETALKGVVESYQPDWIFNAAAMTNVDLCETEIALCEQLNRDSVKWMVETGVPVAHVSTDYVFDGLNGPYREEDKMNPLGVYGRVKMESETLVLTNPKNLIVRTMLLWGLGERLRPSYVDFVRDSLREGKRIKIVKDQLGNPTLASDLALAMWDLTSKGCKGLYHVSGPEVLSRLDWAIKIADYFGLDKGLIDSCTTEELNQAAKRPLNSGFVLDKVRGVLDFKTKGVVEQLDLTQN